MHVDVIATRFSGSIKDWKKVEQIVPLFAEHGFDDVTLEVASSYADARALTAAAIRRGGRVIISAGGSGTFNAVLEGCCDGGVPLSEIRLGFLRKGSADLIGKVLRMPDEITEAAIGAAEAGAAILHLHARDPQTGRPDQTPEGFTSFLPRIKQATDAVVNLTTGGSPYMKVEERALPAAQFKPEVASLNMGSMNFGLFPMLGRYPDLAGWER